MQLVSFEEADAETRLHVIGAGNLPSAIAAFLRLWKHGSPDFWQGLIQSAATLHPDVTEELTSAALLKPFHALLVRTSLTKVTTGHGEQAIGALCTGIEFLLVISDK